MQRIEASIVASVAELRKNPSAVMQAAKGEAVAILNHDRVMAYMISAETYDFMLEYLDDLHLVGVAGARAGEKVQPVDIDEL